MSVVKYLKCGCAIRNDGGVVDKEYCSACVEKLKANMREIGLRDQIDQQIRESLIKDFNLLYVKEFSRGWAMERIYRAQELSIMRLENTVKAISTIIKTGGKHE